MKKILILFTIACVALTSCNDDDFRGGRFTANLGDEILFNSSMKYETAGKKNAATRTVYGDKLEDKTEIKWNEGDVVGIYCENAFGDTKYCDYTVLNAFPNGGKDEDGNNVALNDGKDDANYEECALALHDDYTDGLRWNGGGHTFYGVYPSPKMLSKYGEDEDVANLIKLEKNKLTATLPDIQRPATYVPDNDGNLVVHPAMRYAYMVACEPNVYPSENANVMLKFNPIVTAVEITLKNTGNATIKGVTDVAVSSDSEICGDFEVDLNTTTITRKSSGEIYKSIQIPLVKQGSSFDIKPGNTITFTAFMMPDANLNKLKLTLFYANGVAQKQGTLSATKIVEVKKKNFITNVPLNFSNAVSKVELDRWAASISETNGDATKLSALSIPAAGGAASGHTTNWSANEKYLQQSLTIDNLWDSGIRCFEFTVDNKDSDNDFKDQKVYCNSKPSSISLEEAVNKVKANLIANPTEFAMVIITYQQQKGWDSRAESQGEVSYTRNPAGFMTRLNTFWSKISSSDWGDTQAVQTVDGQITVKPGTALYSPTMTLHDARGKLFCIARPLSEEEDKYTNATRTGFLNANFKMEVINKYTSCTINEKILVVEGWGAVKDRWERRGFTSCICYRGTGNSSFKNADKSKILYTDGKIGRPFDVATNENDTETTMSKDYIDNNLKNLTTNFTYTVKTSNGNATYNAYVHDWARVSNLDDHFRAKHKADSEEIKEFFWANSLNEKWGHITTTFDKALQEQKSGNTLFINSLCGYFIDKSEINSYLPNLLTDISVNYSSGIHKYSVLSGSSTTAGMCGNISDYAKWVNNAFYNYLLTKELGGNATGIIMMDRVSDNANDNPAGYYIPRIILANNPFAAGQIEGDKEIPEGSDFGGNDIVPSKGYIDISWGEWEN